VRAVSQLTRLRAEAKAAKLTPFESEEWPATAEAAQAAVEKLSGLYTLAVRKQQFLSGRLAQAFEHRRVANAVLDDVVSAAYKCAPAPPPRRGIAARLLCSQLALTHTPSCLCVATLRLAAHARTQALQQHPDKRRSGSTADTMAFQRLRTAYDTLRDATLRRAYIDTFNHDKFIADQAAAQAAESAAASSAPTGKALRLGAGVPNRCTCPAVTTIADGAALLQWSCHRAAEFDVSGYEVQGSHIAGHPPVRGAWQQLTDPATNATTSATVHGLAPGEWVFRVRAVAFSGGGDWSMASEGVLLGGEGVSSPEAMARRAAEAAQRAAARKAEAQEAARDNLHRWTSANARRAPDVLDQLSRVMVASRRAGLPVVASDAALMQRAEDALTELRIAADNRAVMAEWLPKLRDVSRRAATCADAAAEFTALIERYSADHELKHPGVRDTTHQLLKRTAVQTHAKLEDETLVERVVALMCAAASRSDVWSASKLGELQSAADELAAARQSMVVAAARKRASEERRLQKERAEAEKERQAAEARAAAAAAAHAEANKQRAAEQARRDAALAAKRAAEQARAAAAAPYSAPQPAVPTPLPLTLPSTASAASGSARTAAPSSVASAASSVASAPHSSALSDFDCPVCLDAFCSGERKEPVMFTCGHSVCISCLDQLRASHRRCPSCREVRSRLACARGACEPHRADLCADACACVPVCSSLCALQPFDPAQRIAVNVSLRAAALRALTRPSAGGAQAAAPTEAPAASTRVPVPIALPRPLPLPAKPKAPPRQPQLQPQPQAQPQQPQYQQHQLQPQPVQHMFGTYEAPQQHFSASPAPTSLFAAPMLARPSALPPSLLQPQYAQQAQYTQQYAPQSQPQTYYQPQAQTQYYGSAAQPYYETQPALHYAPPAPYYAPPPPPPYYAQQPVLPPHASVLPPPPPSLLPRASAPQHGAYAAQGYAVAAPLQVPTYAHEEAYLPASEATIQELFPFLFPR
jgi:hypothetical protein